MDVKRMRSKLAVKPVRASVSDERLRSCQARAVAGGSKAAHIATPPAANGGGKHTNGGAGNGGAGDNPGAPKGVELLSKKHLFAYDREYKGLEGVAIAKNVPADEAFDIKYIIHRVLASLRLVGTYVAARVFADPFTGPNDDLKDLDDFTKNFPPFKFEALVAAPLNAALQHVFEGALKDHFVPLPAVAEYDTRLWSRDRAERAPWASDAIFAEQRLSGNNPVQIRALEGGDPRAGVLRGAVEAGTVDLPSLEDDFAAGSIFVLDYTTVPYKDVQRADFELPGDFTLGSYTETDGRPAERVLPKPLAFFRWDKHEQQLQPVAIRVGQAEGSRVYVPGDGGSKRHDWLFAKLCVQIADFNCHEMQTHLGRTHLAMEPFAVATRACLPEHHPLSVLLRAHTRFMIFNNRLAREKLVGAGGPVEQLLAGTLASSVGLARVSVLSWDLFKNSFPQDIAARGMGALPHYPYRDDGQLVWDATAQFARDFVAAIYKDDAMVAADRDLQEWAASLADPEGGSVSGMPASLHSQQQLADVLTAVIFTCGPQHSAINYTQFEYGGYTLNMPLTARQGYYAIVDRPREEPISEAELLRFLPNLEMTRQQLRIMYLLSAYQYDTLGDYETVLDSIYDETQADLFAGHPQVIEAIENFQTNLKAAQGEIEARNEGRAVQYNFMRPDKVLNSISI